MATVIILFAGIGVIMVWMILEAMTGMGGNK